MKLFICEKPSQGRDIAKILGTTQRGEGFLSGADAVVTWCIGHLLEHATPQDYDAKYKFWDERQLPIIPEKWKMNAKSKTKKQLNVIKQLLKKATSVVIATDADREGEVIAREILELYNWKGKIERLWLSALYDDSIRKALSSIRSGDDTYSLYQAGLGRSRADWLVGMNFTRLYTVIAQQSGYDGVLSVGRVQTPTLKLVVDRDNEIKKFTPKTHWQLNVKLSIDNASFMALWQPDEADCDEDGRCVNEKKLRESAQKISQTGEATVASVKTERIKESAPLPFDLSTLQQICSKKWGMGAQQVLDIAQSLYETHKATTYPRTDCPYLPESMFSDAKHIISALLKSAPSLRNSIEQLVINQKSRAWNDEKITAHHAIIPTLHTPDFNKLNDNELNVY